MKALVLSIALVACSSHGANNNVDGGGGGGGGTDAPGAGDAPRSDGPPIDGSHAGSGRTIFVIPMENESSSSIYGDTTDAPYINNTLMPMSAYTTNFMDELAAAYPSEPHYVWMEAGTNAFSDYTFVTDNDASGTNSTNSTQHLSTQLTAAGIGWVSYQEGMTEGTCPITSISGSFYAAKHDPFVFFQDVSGSPPSGSNSYCAEHHKPYSSFESDLAAGDLPPYVYITPNLCDDMHGATGCTGGTMTATDIHDGDTWLSQELPRILAYAADHDSVIYLVWDEGSSNQTIPFLVLGPHVQSGSNATAYTHSSLLKSVEEQLGVPVLSTVTSANDFSGLFEAGYFP